ncbi:MAG: methyltransferase domain-containing protein [Gammaproteobacteria bacterium]|nr:methyltransferase domain-containing protein [Gammaproteobacteria bacterium]MCP5199985.1 methyltransferase domain-containing protein [Gammaproteobacteria bacterium]
MAEREQGLKPDTINTHINNVYPALAMLAGMQLEVFSALGDEALTAAEAAARLDVQPAKLQPLLYALVTAGLLAVADGRFANTAEAAEFLVKGRPRYIGGAHSAYSDLWSSTMHTAQSIRTGVPQARHDFSQMSQAELSAFIRGLDAGAGATARRLDKTFDMKRFRHLLDAGGGSGGLAIALAKLCPDLRASVAELPNVATVTRECVAESGLGERVDVVEADLVAAPPPGAYDAVVLRSVLQVLSPAQAAAALRHAVAALAPGGECFVVGRMLDDSRLAPLDAVAVNVMFLNVYEAGQAWTESEYRGWFEQAGLSGNTRTPLAGGYSIMHGVKG